MNSTTTAVVLIEFQNDFTTPGGCLHEAVRSVMQQTNMLAHTEELVRQARTYGALIVHVPISFTENFRELRPRPYGILKSVVDSNAFRQGSWGADIVDVLRPQRQDIIIEGKRGLDGFVSTNLDFILRQRGITHVALAGFLTNCCVESTMRTAYELGYYVCTLTDCTATVSEEQRLACEKNFPMFSQPLTHTEFLEQLMAPAEPVGVGRGYYG
ncbi:isochorismatase family cysteine hydrolase [Hymenobacter weizhouensis]|uniref:isochorismatase family cysteine hydrolase n=1 Tax=Hymenobacter sp. YIM 151500-1 TaxID=2987689 RepID=UPI002226462A|nr:isochorismatase family cysteine hydrolase [Hymenobacter sp. YIM 151500-1]UYZ64301.1 cysteine hydrolase [Hymenobacter sp. YIM 151500-1]